MINPNQINEIDDRFDKKEKAENPILELEESNNFISAKLLIDIIFTRNYLFKINQSNIIY